MSFFQKNQNVCVQDYPQHFQKFWLGYSPAFLVRSIITVKSHDLHQVSHVIISCTSTLNSVSHSYPLMQKISVLR